MHKDKRFGSLKWFFTILNPNSSHSMIKNLSSQLKVKAILSGVKKSELHNAYIYQGAENPLSISRVYDIEFICEFNMRFFPFDTQNCSIFLVMAGNSGKFIHLEIDQFNYLGPIDLTQYFVKATNSNFTRVEKGTIAVELKVIFGRRILATILTTYLPTIIICIVAFSTNYFKAFFFEAIVTVNLTALIGLDHIVHQCIK